MHATYDVQGTLALAADATRRIAERRQQSAVRPAWKRCHEYFLPCLSTVKSQRLRQGIISVRANTLDGHLTGVWWLPATPHGPDFHDPQPSKARARQGGSPQTLRIWAARAVACLVPSRSLTMTPEPGHAKLGRVPFFLRAKEIDSLGPSHRSYRLTVEPPPRSISPYHTLMPRYCNSRRRPSSTRHGGHCCLVLLASQSADSLLSAQKSLFTQCAATPPPSLLPAGQPPSGHE